MAGNNLEPFPREKFLKFCSYLKILTKDFGLIKFKLLGTQQYILDEICKGMAEGVPNFVILKARQLGSCLDPDTPVLKADYTWCRIADVQVGDELVAVDEFPLKKGKGGARKMRTTMVEAKGTVFERAYRIEFDDGRSVVCTGPHRWLVRNSQDGWRWRSITASSKLERIQIGQKIRWITNPWGEPHFEDGWFGGILDGEGSISNHNRSGASISASQLPGPVWSRMLFYAATRGYHYRIEDDATERKTKYGKRPVPKLVFNRMDELFRLIGQTLPSRFRTKKFWEGRELPGKGADANCYSTITNIIPLDERGMVDLQTTDKTYIANGFVSHNSTFFMALDLFWAFNHKGVSGAIITHNEQLRDQFRSMLTIYLQNLPPWAKKTATRHSRTQLQFDNQSIFQYLVAGTKDTSKGQMGTGAAFNYIHKSEESAYGNPDDLKNLEAASSTHYPHRLYINETTARGFNHFEKTWESALKSPSYRVIFVGWWRNELFRFERDDSRFQAYVGVGDLSKIDVLYRKRIREVKELYDFDIQPEQMAWYIARVNEPPYNGDQDKMDEDFPFTPEMAFITTGSRFFTNQSLTDQMRRARNNLLQPFKYHTGYDWRETRILPVGQAKRADLKIWEEADPMGRYIVSCDPASGASEKADHTCIQVMRAYADRLIQVAEYDSVSPKMYECAWILAHLCGYYRNVRMILEIAGPGSAVDHELIKLRHEMPQMFSGDDTQLRNCLAGIQYYFYRRADSMTGSVQYQFKMNNEEKHRMMNQLKDSIELDRLVVNSLEALNQCKTIVRMDGYIEAEAGQKDDRVIALGMANHAWMQWEQGPLRQAGMTMLRADEMKKAGPQGIVQNRMVANYLESMKIIPDNQTRILPFAKPYGRR